MALFFSMAFGAMLLSRVLWAQDVWHWSALTTGLAIAPGPLMVPLFSFLIAGRLTARFGPGVVIALGSTVFAAGAAWWALAIGLAPDYVNDMLGGMILTGIGVGLTLPTLMATGASTLPPHSFATGSAVINMLRQIGLAIGVAAADRDPRIASLAGRGSRRLRARVMGDRGDLPWWGIGRAGAAGTAVTAGRADQPQRHRDDSRGRERSAELTQRVSRRRSAEKRP